MLSELDLQKLKPKAGFICKETMELLQREVCSDEHPDWEDLRTKFLTAGVASRVLKKSSYGSGGYGSYSNLLRWYKDKDFRERQKTDLKKNPFVQHGLMYQSEGAAMYSSKTGLTLVPIGFVCGPLQKTNGFAEVPEYISATFDYGVLDYPIVVEIKCPNSLPKNWQEKHWVQCQHQLQLARIEVLHLVFYFPPSRHARGKLVVKVINVNSNWFERVKPQYDKFWKLIKSD